MKESTTYQAILEEGRVQGEARGRVNEAREILLEFGSDQFGPPDAATRAALEALTEEPPLRALIGRLRSASSWAELLGTPTPTPRRRGRRSS